jgi:hypothetical protein
MAQNEADHENLMREAVSLVKRVECQYAGRTQPSLLGLNANGWLFVYLGTDPMYRFDERGRLRRAFVDGRLFRTEGSTLAAMQRKRRPASDAEVATSTLLRQDLAPSELNAFRERMFRELTELNEGLAAGVILRQHPIDATQLVDQLRKALKAVLESTEFLAPPLVKRKSSF